MFANKPNVLCNTDLSVKYLTFNWTISNFSRCYNRRSIRSSRFRFGATNWCLELSAEKFNYNKKDATRPNGKLERFLVLHYHLPSSKEQNELHKRELYDCDKNYSTVDFTMHAIDAKDKLVLLHESINREIRLDEYAEPAAFGIDFVPIEDGNLLSDDDELRLILCISTVAESVQDIHSGLSEESCSRYERNDFGHHMKNGDFSDVTLVVENKEIRAHKVILSTKSSVFEAMFKHEMKENQENKVEINDMTYECVYEMMRFIYTGRVKNLHRLASELLNAADKYDLQKLKMICGNAQFDNLTVETAAEILVQCDRHNLKELKEYTINFIKEKSSEVKLTDGWKMMTQKQPYLVIECFVF